MEMIYQDCITHSYDFIMGLREGCNVAESPIKKKLNLNDVIWLKNWQKTNIEEIKEKLATSR